MLELEQRVVSRAFRDNVMDSRLRQASAFLVFRSPHCEGCGQASGIRSEGVLLATRG